MFRTMLKSKIHRATVTQADLHYVGSVTVDADLMDAADLLDAYLEENSEVSVQNLYIDLLTEINERGFFGRKMTKERLKAWLEEPALELGEIVNRAVDKVAEGMVASELGAR